MPTDRDTGAAAGTDQQSASPARLVAECHPVRSVEDCREAER